MIQNKKMDYGTTNVKEYHAYGGNDNVRDKQTNN